MYGMIARGEQSASPAVELKWFAPRLILRRTNIYSIDDFLLNFNQELTNFRISGKLSPASKLDSRVWRGKRLQMRKVRAPQGKDNG